LLMAAFQVPDVMASPRIVDTISASKNECSGPGKRHT
jgi:hypothetical protein